MSTACTFFVLFSSVLVEHDDDVLVDNLVEHDEKTWLPYYKIERMHVIKNRIGSLVATCHFVSNLTNLDT